MTEGIRGLWFRILWEEGGIVYRRLAIMERPLDDPIPEITARVPLILDKLKNSEVEEYAHFLPEVSPSMIHMRLTRGDLCFVARQATDETIVNVNWLSTSWADTQLDRGIKLIQGDAYHYDGATLPRLRGKGIQQAAIVSILRKCKDDGMRRVIALVSPENKASIRSFNKVGYRRFGRMGYLKIGRWRCDFLKTYPGKTLVLCALKEES